jgi:hypothetical protein
MMLRWKDLAATNPDDKNRPIGRRISLAPDWVSERLAVKQAVYPALAHGNDSARRRPSISERTGNIGGAANCSANYRSDA